MVRFTKARQYKILHIHFFPGPEFWFCGDESKMMTPENTREVGTKKKERKREAWRETKNEQKDDKDRGDGDRTKQEMERSEEGKGNSLEARGGIQADSEG